MIRFSILVNGTPFGFFTNSHGLRQGGSAFSFVVCGGYGGVKLNVECDNEPGIIDRFSVGSRDNEELVVNHLLFADDTLIYCGAQAKHVRNLRCIFLCFEAASGLRINLGKSKLVPIGEVENVENVDNLAHILGCRVASLSMTYLSLPLGASFKATSIWNGVIEKVERRLASWKKLYLFKGGRLTLIKSTLSNVSTYYLSLFPIPVSVA
jgi:hypothetical protein